MRCDSQSARCAADRTAPGAVRRLRVGLDAFGSLTLEPEREVEHLGSDHALGGRIAGVFPKDASGRALDRRGVRGWHRSCREAATVDVEGDALLGQRLAVPAGVGAFPGPDEDRITVDDGPDDGPVDGAADAAGLDLDLLGPVDQIELSLAVSHARRVAHPGLAGPRRGGRGACNADVTGLQCAGPIHVRHGGTCCWGFELSARTSGFRSTGRRPRARTTGHRTRDRTKETQSCPIRTMTAIRSSSETAAPAPA